MPHPDWLSAEGRYLADRLDRLEGMMAVTQTQLDNLTAAVEAHGSALGTLAGQFDTAIAGIRDDIEALKAGAALDATQLEQRVAALATASDGLRTSADALTTLDAENPPVPPPNP